MEQQTIICANCRTPNPAKNLYCQSCGKPLVPLGNSQPAPLVQGQPSPLPQAVSQRPLASYPQHAIPQNSSSQQQVPPPPGYYPQQPAAPGPAGYMPPPRLDQLGTRLDGVVSIAKGGAGKAAEVEAAFLEEMNKSLYPQINIMRSELSGSSGKHRGYQLMHTPAGTVTVYVGGYGKDLSISMDVFVRQTPNMRSIYILLGIAFGLSLLGSFGWLGFGLAGTFFLNFLFGVPPFIGAVILGAIVYGKVWKNDGWHLFINLPDEIAIDELMDLAASVQNALKNAGEKAGLEVDFIKKARVR